MSDTISIVLCTYNGARHLPAQLDSLLAQSRRPDRIVVSDDASIDGSWGLLQAFAAAAMALGIEVVLRRQPCNLGFAANFSDALALAEGGLVFLCDQDDVWHADKLALMSRAMQDDPDLLLLHSNARRVDVEGAPLPDDLFQALQLEAGEIDAVNAGRAFEVYLRRNLATGAATVVRQTLLQHALPVPERWAHDAWLAVCAAALGKVGIWPDALLDYRQHDGNQIGMPVRGWRQRSRDLFRDSRVELDLRRLQLAELWAWLDRPAVTSVPAMDRARLDDLHRHLQARLGLPARRWRRLPGIIAEWRRGGYDRQATGWRSALHDLLGTRGIPQ